MKRIAIFGVHFGYWTVYFLFTALFLLILKSASNPDNFTAENRDNLNYFFWFANVIPSIFGFYLFHYFIFFKIKRKANSYIIFLIGLLFTLSIGFISSIFFEFSSSIYVLSGLVALIHGILGLFMRAFFDWFNLRKEKEQLAEQNHLIEMELVKAQLNPHFLFNSLNNIDVLIYKDQEKASAYLNKLSDIMRYMLFEAKSEMISFDTEFHFIEKYVALHQLRASNSDYVLLTNEIKENTGKVASLVF
ncbi:MAG: sensor histidine kinase, partial [Bacteroidota bacterium]